MSADHHEFSRATVSINDKNDASIETTDQELANAITLGVNDDIMDVRNLYSGRDLEGIVATVVVIWILLHKYSLSSPRPTLPQPARIIPLIH